LVVVCGFQSLIDYLTFLPFVQVFFV